MLCGSSGAGAMGFIAHCVNTACINPAVIEVEQRAHRQRVVNGFVRVAHLMQSFDVSRANIHRVEINFTYKPEQRFLLIGKSRRLRIGKHAIHQFNGSHFPGHNGRMTS